MTSRLLTPTELRLDEAMLADLLGIRFKDLRHLTVALTHRSYLHENTSDKPDVVVSNERFEFLGDAILQFVVADMLIKHFPDAPEGQLTALRALMVSTTGLAMVAEGIGLARFVRASRGEGTLDGRGRLRILAGTVEAIVAAVYTDGGLRGARAVIRRLLEPRLAEIALELQSANVKGRLQELVQATNGHTPKYVVVTRDGPVHAERFGVEVRIGDDILGYGEGTGKRAAEQAAARDALASLDR